MSDGLNRSGEGERPSASSYAKAQLACREVREDFVALHRDELSPLRAESVRSHLGSCPECREQSFEIELTTRSFQKLPELEPPAHLLDDAMKRVLAAHGWLESPSGAWEPPPGWEVRRPLAEAARSSVWFRPVRRPLAWAALAASLLITFALSFVEPLNDAFSRAQRTILGRRISTVLHRATDAFLGKLRL